MSPNQLTNYEITHVTNTNDDLLKKVFSQPTVEETGHVQIDEPLVNHLENPAATS